MGLNIDITSNIAHIQRSLGEVNKKVFYESVRYSIGKALIAGRAEAAKSLRERLNIKSGDVKKKIGITKPKAGSFASLEGILSFDDTPQPLLDFVKGSKAIISQKGIPIKKRKVLKIEITRGKSFKMKGGFIQKVKSTQVFRRGKSGGFKKQSAPSIGEFIQKGDHRPMIIRRMKEVFRNNIKNQYEYRMERLANRLQSAPMDKIK